MPRLEWIAMESNPQSMNSFLAKVGVKEHIKVVDVFGFDDELLAMIEGQVQGLMLCYPFTNSPQGKPDESDVAKELFFVRQTIRNACATMALIHLLANKCEDNDWTQDSSLRQFIKESSHLKAEEKAGRLETNQSIATAHEDVSAGGQTEAPAPSESVEYHFISIINYKNRIYEMDGRKSGPIYHGATSEATFLRDSIEVAKKFINLNEGNTNFSIQAITRMS